MKKKYADDYAKQKLTASIKRWGNGNGILLPKAILQLLSLETDDQLSIEVENGKVILLPIKKQRVSLTERFVNYEGNLDSKEYWADYSIGKEIF